MPTVQVRYIVKDVDAAIEFYCRHLGFHEVMHPAPAFAMLSRGDLRLVLSAPNPSGGGGQPMPDGKQQEPGGWNRFAIEVDDLSAMVETLRNAGAHFRNDIVTGAVATGRASTSEPTAPTAAPAVRRAPPTKRASPALARPARRAARPEHVAMTGAGAHAATVLRDRPAMRASAPRAGRPASSWCPHPMWASWESPWLAALQMAAVERAPGLSTRAQAAAPARTARAAPLASRTARARNVATTVAEARATCARGRRPASMARAAHPGAPDASAETTAAVGAAERALGV